MAQLEKGFMNDPEMINGYTLTNLGQFHAYTILAQNEIELPMPGHPEMAGNLVKEIRSAYKKLNGKQKEQVNLSDLNSLEETLNMSVTK